MSSARIDRYNNLIASFPTLERKGKATPNTSANGYMFTFLTKEGDMAVRLSKEKIEDYTNEGALPCVQHGRTMKDFIQIPEVWWNDSERIRNLIEESFEHTNGLKPK